MNTFITLIVMMVKWVYTYVQTHQIVYINCVQFFVYQLFFNKAWEVDKKKRAYNFSFQLEFRHCGCSSNELLFGDIFLSHVTESNSSCWSGNFGICPELHLALPDSSIGSPDTMIYRLSFKWSKKQTRAPFDLVHHPQRCHKLLCNFRSGVSFASVPTESAHLCTF